MRALRLFLRLVLPAGLAGVLLWSVAPALSLDPYMPEPKDFEQPVPDVERIAGGGNELRSSSGGGHADEGPVRFVSPVIDAPARFDLVGVAGELRPLEYRARLEGEEWTDWVETANGDPVYFGGAEEVQVRSRGVRPEGDLHYVNISGSDTFAGRVLTAARESVNSAFISVASVASAGALPPQPHMVKRAEWGAKRGCRPRTDPAHGEVKAATVHHTVTANDYGREEAPGIVLGICRFHRNGNGWNDVGYNFLVDRFGDVYVGRSGGVRKAVVGAHAAGYNAQTTGISSIGTHTSTPASDAAEDAIVDVIAWKLALNGVKAAGRTRLLSSGGSTNRFPAGRKVRVKRVFGHRRVSSTECPGDELNSVLQRIRARAQELIAEHGGLLPPQPSD
ncbi:MAG TPA: N-acetylmuramoyl-L-alanine amidase [Solirubrobacterales bacterium]|nr:N-acetylmuramoyl-L-alanine amidase [Solirubrobacterales bacterium]